MVWFVQIRTAEERHKVPFYENTEAQAFLSHDTANQLFISGLKGVGKTLLLGHKSAELRRSADVSFVPMNDLVETFTSTPLSLNVQTRDKLSSWPNWQIIWRTALAVVVLKRAGVRLSDEIQTMFADCGPSLSVMAHVKAIILGELVRDIDKRLPRLSANLEALLGQVHSGVYVFLDAIDELVVAHTGEFLKRYHLEQATQFGHLSPNVWAAAQIGFVKAALDIHNNHKHIRIYGAIRVEAIEHYKASDLQNIEPRILHIRYSTVDLKRMFTQKVEQLAKQSPELMKERSGPAISRFLGFRHFVHPTVRNARREPLQEDPLDYIIRHTRGRPRELDELGKAIETIAVEDRDQRTVRERVRIRSSDFYNWAISEALPYWRPEYDTLIANFPSNWISATELRKLVRKMNPDVNEETVRELFKTGLLGCTKKVLGEDKSELRFRQFDHMAPVDETDLEFADYFALHPCVNIATFPHKQRYQPDPWNVAGHGQRYVHVRGHGHVHIGAGALGLGCAVPLLTADTGLGVCVLQRPSDRWNTLGLKSGQTLKLRLKYLTSDAHGSGGPDEIEFTWIDPSTSKPRLKQFLSDWTRGERHLFYIGPMDNGHAKAIIKEAHSVSTAVRGQHLNSLVAPLRDGLSRGVRVYPFENDEAAVRRLRESLSPNDIGVVDVCVDRICLPVDVQAKTLTVSTEAYQKVILLDNTPEAAQLFCPPASGNARNVVVVDDSREYEFSRTRKRVLVNGLHFYFALASWAFIRQIYVDASDAPAIATAKATPLFVRTQEVRDTIAVCNRLFALDLLCEAERLELIRSREEASALRKDIEAQQAEVLDRLLTMPDNLWRILNTEDGKALNTKAQVFLKRLADLRKNLPRARTIQGLFSAYELEGVPKDIATLERLFLDEIIQDRPT